MTAKDLIDEIRDYVGDSDPNTHYVMPGTGRPSYLYGRCTNGRIGCIIGQVLEDMRKRVPEAEHLFTIQQLLDAHNVKYSKEELIWLEALQDENDLENGWKDAVEEADRIIREFVAGGLD